MATIPQGEERNIDLDLSGARAVGIEADAAIDRKGSIQPGDLFLFIS